MERAPQARGWAVIECPRCRCKREPGWMSPCYTCDLIAATKENRVHSGFAALSRLALWACLEAAAGWDRAYWLSWAIGNRLLELAYPEDTP